MEPASPATAPIPLAKRALLITGCVLLVFALAAAAWLGRRVLLLLFASILFAVFLNAVTHFFMRRLRLPRPWALGLTVLLLAALAAGAAWLLGDRIGSQFGQITQQLPSLIQQVQTHLQQYDWGRSLLQHLPNPHDLFHRTSGILKEVSIAFSGVLGVIGNLVIIFFTGLYLAVSPAFYRDGLVRLCPVSARERVRDALNQSGESLGAWLLGKLSLMAVVGVLTAVGLFFLHIPLVLTLALLAAALDFIPNIGPIASAVPAVLLALLQSPATALWVILLYLGVQLLESYILSPLVQRRAVSLPPALLIGAQVLLAVLLGLPGLLLATPLTVLLLVLTRELYVKGLLESPHS